MTEQMMTYWQQRCHVTPDTSHRVIRNAHTEKTMSLALGSRLLRNIDTCDFKSHLSYYRCTNSSSITVNKCSISILYLKLVLSERWKEAIQDTNKTKSRWNLCVWSHLDSTNQSLKY